MDKSLLLEGLSDAVDKNDRPAPAHLGRFFGLDIFAQGYGNASIVGIVLVGLGGGVGLQLARRWRKRNNAKNED